MIADVGSGMALSMQFAVQQGCRPRSGVKSTNGTARGDGEEAVPGIRTRACARTERASRRYPPGRLDDDLCRTGVVALALAGRVKHSVNGPDNMHPLWVLDEDDRAGVAIDERGRDCPADPATDVAVRVPRAARRSASGLLRVRSARRPTRRRSGAVARQPRWPPTRENWNRGLRAPAAIGGWRAGHAASRGALGWPAPSPPRRQADRRVASLLLKGCRHALAATGQTAGTARRRARPPPDGDERRSRRAQRPGRPPGTARAERAAARAPLGWRGRHAACET